MFGSHFVIRKRKVTCVRLVEAVPCRIGPAAIKLADVPRATTPHTHNHLQTPLHHRYTHIYIIYIYYFSVVKLLGATGAQYPGCTLSSLSPPLLTTPMATPRRQSHYDSQQPPEHPLDVVC